MDLARTETVATQMERIDLSRLVAGKVRLTLTREHGMAQLCVINTGDEIPPEHRETIFERFYRMDPAHTGGDQHYGLGLAIAKAIGSAHHGQIEVLCQHGLAELRAALPMAKET